MRWLESALCDPVAGLRAPQVTKRPRLRPDLRSDPLV